MALTLGTKLGIYEIVSALGSGGMGEVYRATDTKLKRQVAIKVLPPSMAAGRDRLARFQREAEVLASLNHPNIAAIYGLEESEGITALVMELVEGDDLSQRIAKGAIPLDEALPIAKQIAEALEAAHEQGIIHRDLKPANIKVRSDGTVKVLDFGLAKAMEPAAGSSPSMSMSPTLTTPAMTQAGMILGTAAYMSPEQARGKTVDKRADIWAFGAVLCEMLSGRRAFGGEDIAQTLANVINKEPVWETLPAATPARIRSIVARCLVKDPRQRLRDMGDVRLALDGAFETAAAKETATPVAPGRWLAWAITAVLAVALVGLAVVYVREAPASDTPLHVSIALPEGAEVRSLALSPDGRTVVVAAEVDNQYQLWLRDLDTPEYRPLRGTNLARVPFWSPDSRSIGFFADGTLKTRSATGGPAQVLCDGTGTNPGGGTWNREGTILFAQGDPGPIYRSAAAGGNCIALTKPDPGIAHVFPEFCPTAAISSTSRHAGMSPSAVCTSHRSTTPLAAGCWPTRSRDGRYLVYTELNPKTGVDIWVLPNAADPSVAPTPFPVANTASMETQGQLSADGHWLAYTSDESGQMAVYVRPFPSGDGHWRVSVAEGSEPRWRLDGKELFYQEGVVGRLRLMAVAVAPGKSPGAPPSFGSPVPLLDYRTVRSIPQTNIFSYAASSDGQRFLLHRIATDIQPTLDVLLNWRGGLSTRDKE